MPFYAFHLNVPAPSDVVAERVRSVVGEAPSFWENLTSSWKGSKTSGSPFLGSVEGLSFRIRRNIQYRNSFLPLIRGRIVPAPTGSRFNVFMFMHPFSFIFMLVWFGLVGYSEWKVADANIARSYLPLLMIVFGLALGLGGFFFEALKVMPLLSEAVFNAAIGPAAAPQIETGVRPASLDFGTERSAGRVLTIVAALAVLAGICAFGFYDHRLRSSPAFLKAIAGLSRSAPAGAALGEPIRAGFGVRGIVHDDLESGYAILKIPVNGSNGNGVLYVVANRTGADWDVLRSILRTENPLRRIDLSPPTKRERFQYPKEGRVYLLPLDDAAASDLANLPAYYKARLDINITLLPTYRLSSDCLESTYWRESSRFHSIGSSGDRGGFGFGGFGSDESGHEYRDLGLAICHELSPRALWRSLYRTHARHTLVRGR
jgi:Cytochrome oxidase complex assembly protein 1